MLIFIRTIIWRDCVKRLAVDLFFDPVPDSIDALFVVKSLKDAVTANHEEVKVILQLEYFDFWLADNDILIPTILGAFGLDVSKSA